MDPHCRIHDGFRRHVRQDVEGARDLQERQDEEEGIVYCVFTCEGDSLCSPELSDECDLSYHALKMMQVTFIYSRRSETDILVKDC